MSAKTFLLSHYCCSPPNIRRRNFDVYSFYSTSGRGRGRGSFRYGEGGFLKRNSNGWKLWADVKSKPFKIADDPTLLRNKEDGDNSLLPWWEEFPKRWVIVILCFSAFLLCNMDRVNMSIAILPMASEYHWSPSTVGLIQSSFFWGYLLTQVTYITNFTLLILSRVTNFYHVDSRRYMGRHCWWEGCLGIWSSVVVCCYSSHTHCCKAWIALLICCSSFHGNW